MVKDTVEFYQKLLVGRVQKIWHLDHLGVQDHTITARNRYTKVLEELDDVLVRGLHLLLEENQDDFVDLSDSLVDSRLR